MTTVTTRRRVTALDLTLVAWRQHRVTVGLTALGALALVGLLVSSAVEVGGLAPVRCAAGCHIAEPTYPIRAAADLRMQLVTGFAAVVAAFWAAPLITREYEQRTHLLAWSQDVSPVRWLVGKVVPLAGVAAGLALLLGAVAGAVGDRSSAYLPIAFDRFESWRFEAFGPLQVGYALFGFALGLALGVLLRRTVPAIGATIVLYAVVRYAVVLLRPFYESPARVTYPRASHWAGLAPDSLYVGGGYADVAGRAVDVTSCSAGAGPVSQQAYDACLTSRGAVDYFDDFQPAERLGTFRLIETAIFVALAALLFGAAVLKLRRATTV